MHGPMVARDEWRAARTALVEELTRLRDQFNAIGWVERSEPHRFSPNATMGFADAQPILR
jgi:hypothetical protein